MTNIPPQTFDSLLYKKKNTWSLSKKAILGILAVFLPVISTFLLVYNHNRVYLKNRVLDTLTIIAEAYEGHVYQFLEQSKRRARDFASDGFIRTQVFRMIRGNTSAADALSKHLIKNKIALDETITTIHILSTEGKVLASTNKAEIGRDLSREVFFIKGKDAAAVTETHIHHMGYPELAISTPVLTKNTHRIIGVIVNFVQISELDDLLGGEYNRKLGAISWGKGKGAWKTMAIYLVNRDKLMLTNSIFIKNAILKQTVDTLPVRSGLTSKKEITGLYKDYRGIDVVGASMYIPSLQWVLLIEIDKDEVFAPIKNVLISAGITGIVVIGMIVSLLILFLKKVVKPLYAISQAATDIARGNLDSIIPAKTNDEIGALCESFNVMSHDIKTRTSELIKSNERLAEAQRIARLGNWEWDITKNELHWSDEVYRIFGMAKGEFVASYEVFLECVHPDDLELVKKSVDDAIQGKKPYEIDHRILLKDNIVRIVHEKATVLFDNNRKAIRIAGTVQDITERRQKEEEVNLLQSLILAVGESGNLHDALVITLEKVCSATSWIYGEAWVIHKEGKYLERDHTFYSKTDGLEKFSKLSGRYRFSPGVGLPGRVWLSKQPEWIHDVTLDANYLRAPLAKEAGLKAGVAFPVLTNEEVIAVIAFYMFEPREKDERLINLVSSATVQLGQVIKRKQAEDALRKSEETLHSILNNTTAVVYVKDIQGRYTFINKRFEELFHIKMGEIKGKTDYDLWPAKMADAFRKNDLMAIKSGTPLEFDEIAPHEDGEHSYISVKFPIFDNTGAVKSVCGISTDITWRKKAEKALSESEEKLRSILDNTQAVVYIKDRQGRYLFINRQFEKLFHLKNNEVEGKTPYNCFPKEIAESHLANDRKVFDSKIPMKFEEVATHEDGQHTYISVKFPLYDYTGAVYAVCGISTDITERKQMESQLRKLSRAIEQSPAIVIITDTSGVIQYVNPKFTQSTGYAPEEVIGNTPRILKSGMTPKEEYTRLWNTITSGNEWKGEFINKKKTGELFWEIASISPIKNTEGMVTNFVGVAEDITAFKQEAEEKEKLKEQLYHTQKLESIGQLAGGIAHDFNNILTAIIGYGNLIQMAMKENNPIKDYAQKILLSAEKASHLTKGILAFGRKQINNPKPVNLNEIIRATEHLLLRIIGEDVELKTSLSDNECIVMADSGQIEQILMNLATNARDAMPNGGILTINTEIVELDNNFTLAHGHGTPGRHAVIIVSDTGTGMDEKTRKKIFEPFFTTKEVGKGTGLGLAIIYGIVKQHNSYINVYSEPGKGTIFRIYMPMVEPAAEMTQRQETPSLLTVHGTETILIAEDEEEIRHLVKMVLETAGYTVITAVNGKDAISKYTKNREKIQLLLFDVIMPGKNGKEAYDAIRKKTPGIKVLFTSGYSEDMVEKKIILKEGLHFIPKPVSPSELLKKVREALDK
ncbi:MAG: PAS domain S-box protein [Planctomycetes bacterium]|nr:PAS domain S-box protein [Planctomycetota bacterium]